MRIAYLMQEGAPDVRRRPLDGPANHAWQVVSGLRALGHEIRLLARFDNGIVISENLVDFQPVSVRSTDMGPSRRIESAIRGVQSRLRLPYLGYFESRRFCMACVQELRGFDVLLERMGWMGYGGGLAARRLRVPLVLEVNNGDFVTELERRGVAPRGIQRRLAIETMRRAVTRVAHVVATGEGHARRFIDWWGVAPGRVSVVENGSEVVDLLTREQLRCFRTPAGTATGIQVVFVGAFEAWHGIRQLVSAMPDAVARVPGTRLTLIGSGSEEGRIRQLIADLNLGPYVEMTGPLDIRSVARRLADSDIGVAPYCGWMEYSGLKLFDYKAAGLGIVASGEGGQPSTLEHGRTALVVPPCDVMALSKAIVTLAEDADLRKRLGQSARIEAEERHSWRHTVCEIERILVETVETARHR